MESLDGLVQRLVEVSEQSLEAACAEASLVCQLRCVGADRRSGAGNEKTYCPVVLSILHIELSILCRDNGQCLTKRVCNLGLDVLCDGLDVLHHAWNIREDDMVLALEDIVRRVTFSLYDECVVDESLSEGLDLCYGAFQVELAGNVNKCLLHISVFKM